VYSSCFVYRTLATELHRTLAGKRILSIFSTSKDEILFQFGELHEELQLTVNFAGGEMFFKLGNTITQRGKYAIQWFRRLENDVIHSIHTVPNDRGFVILTASGHQLYFKGFGKFGNIVFFAVEQPLPDSIFRNQLKRDLSLPQPILVKEESYVFKAELPNYLSGEQKQFLKEKGYHSVLHGTSLFHYKLN
jgi:hypothetical protein